MKALKRIVLIMLLMLCAQGAYAQSEATTQAEQSFKKADAELNQTYNLVLHKLAGKKQKADFIKSQKAWLDFRDADAEFRAGVTGGGSAYSMDYLADLAELTEARTMELKEFLKHLTARS